MNFAPSPTQALVLWRLLFTGEQPPQSRLRPALSHKDRRALVAAGLLEAERRGRVTHLVPSDQAWDWALAHLDAPLPRSVHAGPVLQCVLAKLQTLMRAYDIPLAEVVGGARPGAAPRRRPHATGPAASAELIPLVRVACLRLSGGRTNARVRLTALRAALLHVGRTALDDALLAMERGGDVVLMTLDNPAERKPADERAALHVAGETRHLVYLAR